MQEPVFAIIGAWLIYQFQSKDEISGDAYERMFRNAIITTACICVLSNFGPIDDWYWATIYLKHHKHALLDSLKFIVLSCIILLSQRYHLH